MVEASDIQVKIVRFENIPIFLLRQKKIWDTMLALRQYSGNAGCTSFLFELNGKPVGALVMTENNIYRTVMADTLIVDKPLRVDKNFVKLIFNVATECALAFAKARGRDGFVWITNDPKSHLDYLNNPDEAEIVEYAIKWTVKKEDEDAASPSE